MQLNKMTNLSDQMKPLAHTMAHTLHMPTKNIGVGQTQGHAKLRPEMFVIDRNLPYGRLVLHTTAGEHAVLLPGALLLLLLLEVEHHSVRHPHHHHHSC